MGRYITRRLLQGIPTFFGVTIITFMLMVTAPGDPIALITFGPRSNPEMAATLRRQLGLDQPAFVQYAYWLVGNDWVKLDVDGDGTGDTYGERKGLLRGDLGQSILHRESVTKLIAERIPATLLLTLSSLVIGYTIGVLLGVLAAIFHRGLIDQLVRIISVIGNAVPAFWLGLLMILYFSVRLGWLPQSGMRTGIRSGFDPLDTLEHMIMPVAVLSLNTIAFSSRFTRTEILEVLEQDYVRTARAKGLSSTIIWMRHALRNALIPVATFVGQSLGTLLAGAVIIESVFLWPGMGKLVIDAVNNRDYPIIMGTVVIASLMFIIGVLISDVLYALLDPRIRFR